MSAYLESYECCGGSLSIGHIGLHLEADPPGIVRLESSEAHARATFAAMSHERLVAQALKWRGNAQEYARQRDAIRPGADALIADAMRRLGRVQRLVSARRKTVSMADLRAALYDPLEYETAPAREVVQVQGELL
jgi:hypothetical protein